jgi:hypothetical protein
MGRRACRQSISTSPSTRRIRASFELIHSQKVSLIATRTDEGLLNELFLGRPSFEIRLLNDAYRLKHGEIKGNLIKAVKDDLSLDTAHSEYRFVYLIHFWS